MGAAKPRFATPGIESDLAAIVAAWPTLPEAVRAGIVAMGRPPRRLSHGPNKSRAATMLERLLRLGNTVAS
jgi:hypothetical protein